MVINVSINLYKSLKNKFLKENKNYTDNQIIELSNQSIYQTLFYDKYINETYKNCNFIEIQQPFQGVIVNNDFIVFFSMILSNDFRVKGRNTFLSQGFYPAYKVAKKLNLPVKVSLNPYSVMKRIENNLDPKFIPSKKLTNIRTTISEMKLLQIEFSLTLNDIENFFDDNLQSYLNAKKASRNTNKGNNGIWLLKELQTNNVNVYGVDNKKDVGKKDIFDGAKWGDLFLVIKLLETKKEQWNIENLYFIIYQEYKHKSYTKKIKIIQDAGFNVINNLLEQNSIFVDENLDTEDDIIRRQTVFRNNILKEYNFNYECFACNYGLNLQASHIHRFSDIRKEFKNGTLSKKEAQFQAVDGVNGFMLCPNHDKEFENGIIYFDLKTRKFMINKNTQFSSNSINNEIKSSILNNLKQRLSNKILNLLNKKDTQNRFIKYITKHYERINIFPKK
ncbi:HNH endonuclease [Mycoplasma miroungirhinis]|uniref:HNH nuclease domain-containing protein n=1 Tax=Mycoplasma miroungirhinis TaxID=754516 RepID=A0A6M4JDL5_9MOLU|nr:HNH endonuclease [Mycoplasma miroungirhinis]QJR44157.1 hypothetical protein HLA92_01775 [Mycoplasma miroungirhinis]